MRASTIENDALDAAAHAARPPGVPARLRRTLYQLLAEMHRDPEVPKADIRPFQKRLSELVRDRRDELEQVAKRLTDARDYAVAATHLVRDIIASMAAMSPGEAATLPFADERSAAATRIEMARVAVKDARSELQSIAHDWPEITPIAELPDWKKLPFGQLSDLLMPRDVGAALRSSSAGARIGEAHEMVGALALWIDELRRTVADAPPPS